MWVLCHKGVGRLVFRSVCLGFVTWNGCLKTGVLVGLSWVCDMERAFCVTKVWGKAGD